MEMQRFQERVPALTELLCAFEITLLDPFPLERAGRAMNRERLIRSR